MNKNKLKTYAPTARKAFIQTVTDRAHFWGLSEKETLPLEEKGDIAIIGGRPFSRNIAGPRRALEDRIRRDGFNSVMEAVAYTWFNRFMALRYLEIHGYLEHGFRVLSNPNGGPIPEILEQAAKVELPGLDKSKVIELKLDGTKDSELYRMLLVAQCNALHAAMPFLFERINDETELLLPDNLLHSDSLIRKLVMEIDEEDWQEVEIIGWLYQFYISEKKDQVIGSVVKSEDIPAATQLFTPKWIVKYMVQNSLGRMWLATYPNSPLRAKMEYYIEPAKQTEDVQAQLKALTPATLNPEPITFLDPASGSGHILVEAYDIFKEIYLERGYSSKDYPRLILEKNLYGLDIDDRAAQMTGFALLMKARQDDRRILQNGNSPKLNVMSIQESKDLNTHDIADHLIDKSNTDVKRQDIVDMIELFLHGKTFGSLITIPEELAGKLPVLSDITIAKLQSGDMFARQAAESILTFIKQAKILAGKYDCVVTNPPYMGAKFFPSLLKNFINNHYSEGKSDAYGSFIIRNINLVRAGGYVSMITIPSWMFLTTFADLRNKLIKEAVIDSLIHNGRGVFGADFGSCSFVLRHSSLMRYVGTYKKLFVKQSLVCDQDELSERYFTTPQYHCSTDDFVKIPETPIVYWISDRIRDLFVTLKPLGNCYEARQGLATADNDRFLRYWSEVNINKIGFKYSNRDDAAQSNRKWFPYNKGGAYRKWYGNLEYVVNWENDGKELFDFRPRSVLRSPEYYFQPSVSWSKVTIGDISFRYIPEGALFDVAGCSIFKVKHDIEPVIGLLNSKLVKPLLSEISPSVNYEVGQISRVPFKMVIASKTFVRQLIQITREDWDSFETSWDFQSFPWLNSPSKAPTVGDSWQNWEAHSTNQINRMQELETENNRIFIEAYGLQDELTPEVPEDQITLARADREADMKRLISYTIGCMMGRYSLDQPGLVYAQSGNIGFDSTKYKSFPADDDGIVPVMDLDWFEDDAACRFESFLKVAWSADTLEENLKFVADSLSPKSGETPRETIRRYISMQFFKDHLQTYKKRPIYWLFSSGKQRAFECLVYLHRYNEATLSRMRNEYVTPLQGKLAARADFLANEIEAEATTSARSKLQKQLDTLKKKRVELAAFDDLLRHFADQRIALDLDDGVKVNYGKFGNLLAEVKAITGSSE